MKRQLSKAKEKSDWVTRKEAIAMLKCSKVKYYELVKYGQINAFTFTNKAFVERLSIERFIATHNLKYNKARRLYLKKEADCAK